MLDSTMVRRDIAAAGLVFTSAAAAYEAAGLRWGEGGIWRQDAVGDSMAVVSGVSGSGDRGSSGSGGSGRDSSGGSGNGRGGGSGSSGCGRGSNSSSGICI